jgi:phosphoglycolate phosphatase
MTSGELADATIVFDLDGTLVDTAPDIVRALNETMGAEGLPRVKLETVRMMIGQGARVLIERTAARAGVNFRQDKLDQLTETFVEFYRADIARDSRAFPGVEDTLAGLAAMGAKLAVCTNKRTELSVQLLGALRLADWFAAIVGADAVTHKKPHSEHYSAAVTRAGGTLRRSVMVGDSAADVGTARGAGAPVIVMGYGYTDVDAEKLGADVVLSSFSELAPACRRLLAARP